MKILVCISKTPDTTSKISFSENNTELNKDGVQFIMNPYDEWFALVRAIELKEAHGGSVRVICVGDNSNDIIVRKALAIGADDAVRVDAKPASSIFVAHQIAAHAAEENYDLIFLGKESISYNGAEVGAMVAECLDLPFISFANHMEMDGEVATITREVEGGEEISTVSMPFVVSAAKGMAEQRIPNMRGIMMAKRKPLSVVPPVPVNEGIQFISFDLPTEKTGVKMIDADNVGELVRLLHEEAKVI